MNEQLMKALWGQLHWLAVLAQQGSYTAAAARLGVSKAAVSQHITELERSVGVALVRRTTRSMRLTEAGQRLVDQTSAAFEQIFNSFSEAQNLAGVPRGLLRVTAPVAFARQQLVPRLAEFLAAYPDIKIELELSDKIRSLVTEGFDVAIRHTSVPPDTHVAWTLCATKTMLVASRAYLGKAGVPDNPNDLKGHSCLYYPREQGTPAWSFLPKRDTNQPSNQFTNQSINERITVPVNGVLCANNSEALRDAALAHLGIASLPDFSVQRYLRAGELVQVLPEWLPVGAFAETIYALRPYSGQVPLSVTVFVKFLRDALAQGF